MYTHTRARACTQAHMRAHAVLIRLFQEDRGGGVVEWSGNTAIRRAESLNAETNYVTLINTLIMIE